MHILGDHLGVGGNAQPQIVRYILDQEPLVATAKLAYGAIRLDLDRPLIPDFNLQIASAAVQHNARRVAGRECLCGHIFAPFSIVYSTKISTRSFSSRSCISKIRPGVPASIARMISSVLALANRGANRAPSFSPTPTRLTGIVTLIFWRRVFRSVTRTRSVRAGAVVRGRSRAGLSPSASNSCAPSSADT